jgi:hypothetical protein
VGVVVDDQEAQLHGRSQDGGPSLRRHCR